MSSKEPKGPTGHSVFSGTIQCVAIEDVTPQRAKYLLDLVAHDVEEARRHFVEEQTKAHPGLVAVGSETFHRAGEKPGTRQIYCECLLLWPSHSMAEIGDYVALDALPPVPNDARFYQYPGDPSRAFRKLRFQWGDKDVCCWERME